jgi:hypothetical protein
MVEMETLEMINIFFGNSAISGEGFDCRIVILLSRSELTVYSITVGE